LKISETVRFGGVGELATNTADNFARRHLYRANLLRNYCRARVVLYDDVGVCVWSGRIPISAGRMTGVKLVTNIGSAECVALALYVGAMTE